jgi:long-subunit acyl-CoA synthetase (AMP-forming)
MVFYPPAAVPKLPEVPDSIPVCDFMLDEQYGRRPISDSWDPYTCGISGKSITSQQQKDMVEPLARALAKEFGWKVNHGTEYDKVAGVFALNTIEIMTLSWALHRLNGVSSPANAAYSADELCFQLTNSGSKVLFTVMPLLDVALKAAAKANIPQNRI